jgi:hypothetical protein
VLSTDNVGIAPAQFRVLVDGKDVTGVISSETAQYSHDQYQTLTINGAFANAQTVDIQTVDGSALYVKEIAVGGRTYQAVDAAFSQTDNGVPLPFMPGTGTEALYWAGDLHFQTSAAAPSTTPAVSLSAPTTGDPTGAPPAPGHGLQITFSSTNAAEFRVLVDGQDVTGRIVGTAQTSQGEAQVLTVAGDFSHAHTVDIQFLNESDSYNSGVPVWLDVKSLSINGKTLQSRNAEFTRSSDGAPLTFTPGTGTEALYWNGTLRFPLAEPPQTLIVGNGQQYATLADAVAAAHSGDTVLIQAGTYVDQTANIDKDLTIKALGGPVIFTETHAIDNEKAYLVVNGNVTIDGLTFQGATVFDGNGAGIRFESGNLVVKNSTFIGNQEGILTTGEPTATLAVDNSVFLNNGAGDGFTHGIYAGTIASLTVTNSAFEGTSYGHDVKSRAASTTISNNTFDDNTTASYAIDLPNGGIATVTDNVIAKAATTDNYAAIHYGGEIENPVGSLTVSRNTIVSQRDFGVALLNDTTLPVTVSANAVFGENALVIGGDATITDDNLVASGMPAHLPLPSGYTHAADPVFADLLQSFQLSL